MKTVTNNTNIKIFDPLHLPLYGERLIEASAGTGKTYIIAVLYLRLLLGLGNNQAFPRLLTVKELLVVTFTEAATKELCSRIRQNIHEFRIACLRQASNNPLHMRLLNEINDINQALELLLMAERQMDEAAIFTIHSFCQRMLNLYTFESGISLGQRLIEDEYALRYQACADFWRCNFYPLSRDIANIIHEQWKGPEDLLKTINPYLQGEIPIIKPKPLIEETLITRHHKIITLINDLKQKWHLCSKEIELAINNSDIDRRKFSYSNQEKWIKKISSWVYEETYNYILPNELKKFSKSFLATRTKIGGSIPEHVIFSIIEYLLVQNFTLNDLLISQAITEVRKIISHEKKCRGKLSFDDMLNNLDVALTKDNNEELASTIRTRFPVVIVDEFQDTDQQQYSIFYRIWHHQPNTCLLLIGDPKQAIYAFRGADVFTYMQARNKVQACYTLDINWRSAPGMVNSVNTLFQRANNPFVFQNIPFRPVKSAAKNSSLCFEYYGKIVPAMKLWLIDNKNYNTDEYKTCMAQQCAAQIRDWLNAGLHEKALLLSENNSRPIKASDITVLVRNHQEAMYIHNALMSLNIPSVYLSNHHSVFETLEAQEILWLLQAVLSPKKKNVLRCALASSILGLNARNIDSLNRDIDTWETIVEEFNNYQECWRKYGVMPMLRKMITHRCIAENILKTPGGERRLTNILHISELLQETDLKLKNEHALTRWLAQRIAQPNSNCVNQRMRLESDKHLVQIVTIHKSKGLEYPLVWLPFIANRRIQNQAFYHDRVSFKRVLDLNIDNKNIELAEMESLAEDLRLLYVALTRAIWHCSLGIPPLKYCKKKNTDNHSNFHQNALWYLIQQGEAKNINDLYQSLESICNSHITLCTINTSDNSRLYRLETPITELQARYIQREIMDDWLLTSYSDLQGKKKKNTSDLILNINTFTSLDNEANTQKLELTPHQFPRGTTSGIFLHDIFRSIDFSQPISTQLILEKLQKSGYETYWQPMIVSWVQMVLNVPLNKKNLSLNQISIKNKLAEMEFYLPIKKKFATDKLDKIIKHYDPISAQCDPLDSRKIYGMLKGFIDLVFRYDNRYYLLDYKSNWLGVDSESYTHYAMLQEIQVHRYDVQYQLYTLALHRYLRNRLTGYNYELYFGNVIYLFLRGVNIDHPQFGVFTVRPDIELINELDVLFAGNIENSAH